MTLKEIRKIDNQEQLKRAIEEFCNVAQLLTYGEYHAMQSEIQRAGERIGLSITQLNKLIQN